MNIVSCKLFITISVVCCLVVINSYGMQKNVKQEQEIEAKMESLISKFEESINQCMCSSSSMTVDRCISLIREQSEKKIQEFKLMIDATYGSSLNEDFLGNGENTPLANFAKKIRKHAEDLSTLYKEEFSNRRAKEASNQQKKLTDLRTKSKEAWPDIK